MNITLPHIPNNVYSAFDEALAAPTHPFRLCLNPRYLFYYNDLFEGVSYDNALYQNSQSLSDRFRRHLKSVAQSILMKTSPESKIVEIGCGKGYFIELLESLGCTNIFGFDSTYEGDNPRIKKRYFDLRDNGFNADTIILRHTLEHIPNPLSFLEQLFNANSNPLANIFIEVPCFDWIVDNQAFWDLTIEHCNYFTAASFKSIFNQACVSKVFDGQYLLVSASASDLNFAKDTSLQLPPHAPIDLSDLFPALIAAPSELKNFLKLHASNQSRYWIWGAATKGVMYLWHNLRMLDFTPPVGLIDINTQKHGKFVGCLGYEILPPDYLFNNAQDGDLVIVANPAYINEVRDMISCSSSKSIHIEPLNLLR